MSLSSSLGKFVQFFGAGLGDLEVEERCKRKRWWWALVGEDLISLWPWAFVLIRFVNWYLGT